MTSKWSFLYRGENLTYLSMHLYILHCSSYNTLLLKMKFEKKKLSLSQLSSLLAGFLLVVLSLFSKNISLV